MALILNHKLRCTQINPQTDPNSDRTVSSHRSIPRSSSGSSTLRGLSGNLTKINTTTRIT
jgi:hypothetical protein